jgi:hypothetical protein
MKTFSGTMSTAQMASKIVRLEKEVRLPAVDEHTLIYSIERSCAR